MGKLADDIAAAESRLNKAKEDGDASAEAEAKGELAALRRFNSEGWVPQSDTSQAVIKARDESYEKGRQEARQALYREVGVSDADDPEAELKRIREKRDGEKSEAERYKSQAETLQSEKEAEANRVQELENRIRERDRRDAIVSALSEAKYQGKTSHAIGAIDPSRIKEEGGSFDATEAVKALKEDDFYGFPSDEPNNPPPTPRGNDTPQGGTAADKFNERLKRRGRPLAN